MKQLLLFLFALLVIEAEAQNVGIGTTNFTPSEDALLEMRSTSSGLLIPRMTVAQRDAILLPTEGLMIYQTNADAGFKYFDGVEWTTLADDLGDHKATLNVHLEDHWLSNDGGNEGIRIADNGYVGIGESTPGYPVHLTSAGVNTGFGANNSNYLMRIEHMADANNGAGIVIKGSRNMVQLSGFIDFSNYDSSHGDEYVLGRVGATNESSGERGALSFFTNEGGSDNAGLTEKMRIDSDGNVGIGTTDPARALHVVSTQSNRNVAHIQSTASDGWSSIDFLDHSGSLSATFGFANSGTSSTFSNRAYMNSYDHDFILTRNSSESSIFIEGSNGRIGLNTDNPQARLHVEGDMRVSDLAGSGTRMVVADANGNISSEPVPTSPWTEAGSNVVRTLGQVGIGTSTPETNLDLYGNGTSGFTPVGTTARPNPAAGPEIGFGRGGFGKPGATIQMIDYDGYSAGLAFNVKRGVMNSAGGVFANNWPSDVIQALTIVNNGRVGIGTSDPNAELEVEGGVRVTDLSGAGTRMVVADANGDLSTQAIPSGGGGGGSSAYGVNGTGSQSRSSTSYANVNDMSLTLTAGTYILQYNSEVWSSNSSNRAQFAFSANGGTVSSSTRVIEPDNNEEKTVTVTSVVTVNSTQTVRVTFRKFSGSGSVTVGNRCFTAIRL